MLTVTAFLCLQELPGMQHPMRPIARGRAPSNDRNPQAQT